MAILSIRKGERPGTGGLINISVGFLFVLKPRVQWKSWDTQIVPVSHRHGCLNEAWSLLSETDIKRLSDLRL